jgi:D-3-phosphoglycerate dehydrogenase
VKVLVSDNLAETGIEKLQAVDEFEVEVNTSLTPDELVQVVKDYDALVIRSATKVTEEVIAAADNLRVIARAGIGLDNVDITAASKRGIVVMNTPEGNVITTAEHTIAMLMALTRNIPQACRSLKEGRWDKKKYRGREVFHKVLGIIGIGRIGRVVAERAKGLKMNVIGYDPYINPEMVEKLGIEAVTLDELLAKSDYITIHVPKTKETTDLVNADLFGKMKPGVFLVNCARGGIVNEAALLDALNEGTVAGAAMDVFAQEPPKDNPLVDLEQVICTPHLGASTDEAQENVAVAVAEQVIDYLKNNTIRNAVNAPSIDGEVLANLQPYLTLSEELGNVATQISQGPIQEVHVEYVGESAEVDTKTLTISLLKGLFTPILGDMVNFVNAPVHARERDIQVIESVRSEARDFKSLINVTVTTSEDKTSIAGTIFGKNEPRLVRINDFRLEAEMEGHLLFIFNIDTPGTIGAIGTCLGKHDINISMMDVGRMPERGQNIILLRTDSSVPEHVVNELLDMKNVTHVQVLNVRS